VQFSQPLLPCGDVPHYFLETSSYRVNADFSVDALYPAAAHVEAAAQGFAILDARGVSPPVTPSNCMQFLQ